MDADTSAPLHQECRIVEAAGQLDLLTTPAFGLDLRAAGREAAGYRWRLIVDLSRVSFMDASPLHELCAARNRHEARGGWLRVVYTHAGIALLLRAAGLTGEFPRYASVHDALHNQSSRTYE
ncbi:STAS domain-containing protein [Streptomyces sp. A7024]|uniref:STAS domain-containing protein n=1 Tax=Streptomyces coryli TaxID=1128680 RepID=A0A6G4U5Y8_9ACTN|nr:STAS domain-containing protein [Streptomyces coryli]NGN67594.1 STAS domain-containing protein [Streptomyces coryli]